MDSPQTDASKAYLSTVDQLRAENRELRIMLYVAHTNMQGYHDDGELQDAREQPFIDFKRDSVEEIQKKLIERIL